MSCPDCTNGEVMSGEPTGTISMLGSYFSPGPRENSQVAIVLLTDVFGLPLKNCKIIADKIALDTGFDVWVPDYFDGRPIFPLSKLKAANRKGGRTTFWEGIWFILSLIPTLPAFYHSRPALSDQRVIDFVSAVKKEKKYESFGAVGYCFGGSTLARLGGKDIFTSIVICHPGPFTLDEAKGIKCPVSWVCAEEQKKSSKRVSDDQFFDGGYRQKVEAIFAERNGTRNFVDYEFKDYKGTVHGFAIRPNLAKEEIKSAFEGSLDQIKSWFLKTISV